MRIAGSRLIAAPRDAVFDAIHDPSVLLACIPGCEQAERCSPTEYRARLALRLAAIGGTYELSVRVEDAIRPASCRLEGRLDGRPGTITGQATLELTDAGTAPDVVPRAAATTDATTEARTDATSDAASAATPDAVPGAHPASAAAAASGLGCRLDYVADARIDGPLAWLDSSLVERLARGVLEQGLDRLAEDLARRAVHDELGVRA